MNRSRPIARLATADDLRAWVGRMPPVEWCIAENIVGYTAERASEIVGLGFVTWDEYGRAWGWLEKREALPTLMMHRKAKAMLALLRDVGEPALYAFCSQTIPGSEKWLRRLGFVPAPELTTDPDHPVHKCSLST
jgi:hypothetical protein